MLISYIIIYIYIIYSIHFSVLHIYFFIREGLKTWYFVCGSFLIKFWPYWHGRNGVFQLLLHSKTFIILFFFPQRFHVSPFLMEKNPCKWNNCALPANLGSHSWEKLGRFDWMPSNVSNNHLHDDVCTIHAPKIRICSSILNFQDVLCVFFN